MKALIKVIWASKKKPIIKTMRITKFLENNTLKQNRKLKS